MRKKVWKKEWNLIKRNEIEIKFRWRLEMFNALLMPIIKEILLILIITHKKNMLRSLCGQRYYLQEDQISKLNIQFSS